jgi:hypothetical protein
MTDHDRERHARARLNEVRRQLEAHPDDPELLTLERRLEDVVACYSFDRAMTRHFTRALLALDSWRRQN